MTDAQLKTVFTVRRGSNKINNTKKSQLTEVHGMQTLDMKFKLHTMFFFYYIGSVFVASVWCYRAKI